MPGWNYQWCELKTVGVCSPGASQRAAGREAVPPRRGGTELATDASSALSTKSRELSYRFAHHFSFSWSSLICTRLHSLGICAGSSVPLGGKQRGQGMRYLWNYNALVSTSIPNTARHFPPGQLPDGCWSELVSPERGMTRDIPNQLQHAFSCGYSSFKSQLLFTETAACCDNSLLLRQSFVHTLARKTKSTVFT